MKLPVSSPPILFVCLLLSGCRNAPGDLAMQVTCPTDVAEPGKPMPLTVTLTALNGPLCLGKMPAFTAELQHEASGQTWTSRPHLLCGTGAALSLPLSPVLAGAAMADVADVMDRFNLLHAGDSRACRIHVVADKAGRIMVLDDEPKMTHDVRREWPAGRYRLRMTLVRTVDPRYVINLYPPPLGWRLYDQPVIAECSFERSPVAEHDG